MTTTNRLLALALAGIILTPAIASAQTPVTIGVKAGVNLAKLNFDDEGTEVDVKSLLGGVGGVFLSKSINDSVGWRLEGLFSQKGAKNAESGPDAKYKLTYVDVPLLLTLGTSSSTGAGFNVFTGPQVSFNTGAKFVLDGQPDVDFKDEVKSTDLGWVLGVGLESGRMTADVRYTMGLSNINDAGDNKLKNRVISAMVGIKLK